MRPSDRADLLRELPFFDAHTDTLQKALDLGQDLGRRCPGHLDVERGLAGGLGAVVLASWAHPALLERTGEGAAARTTKLLRELHRLCRRHPERVALVGNGEELEAVRGSGRLAAIGGIEGGHSIEEDLGQLQFFFDHGIRMLTLVWNNHLSWIRSCQEGAGPEIPAGLSAFGREVVARMNELGMAVDLSHASRRAFLDAVETSAQPVVASHSGCKALHDHPRNLDDEQLRVLAANEGVCCIVFYPGFLDAEGRAEEMRQRKTPGYAAIEGESYAARTLAESAYLQARCAPTPLARLVDHIVHVAEVAGIEHVGLGSDYDGIDHTIEELEDGSCYPVLLEALERRGFTTEEMLAVAGGNLRRLFAEVTGPGTRAAEVSIRPLHGGL